MMLGGDKEFNDKLSWALLLPLSAMAGFAAVLALMMAELLLEGQDPGSLSAWTLPAKGFAATFAGVLMGAYVAPARKLVAAAVLSLLCLGVLQRYSRAWPFLAAGAAGAAAACLRAARIPPDKESK